MNLADRLEFRPAQSSDGMEIYQIFREAFRAPVDGDLKTLKDTYVGVVDGEVVSMGVLNVYPKKSYVYLHSFAVKKSYRRRGIGRQFLSYFLNLAKIAGCQDFFLHARETNPASHPLYFGAGFDYYVPDHVWGKIGIWLDALYWFLMGQKAPIMLYRPMDKDEDTNAGTSELHKNRTRQRRENL